MIVLLLFLIVIIVCLVNENKQLKDEIMSLRNQIESTGKHKNCYCPRCNMFLGDKINTIQFCPNCGLHLRLNNVVDKKESNSPTNIQPYKDYECPYCGTQFKSRKKVVEFCPSCGNNLNFNKMIPASKQTSVIASKSSPVITSKSSPVITSKPNPVITSKPKPVKEKSKYTDKEIKNNLILITGSILLIVSALLFLTTTWNSINNVFKIIVLIIMLAIFLATSYIADKYLHLKHTSKAFYYISLFYMPIIVVASSAFGLPGSFFSITGPGKYIYLALCFSLLTIIYYILSKKQKEIITVIFSIVSSIITVMSFAAIYSTNFSILLLALSLYFLILNILYINKFYFVDKNIYFKTIYTIFISLNVLIHFYSLSNFVDHSILVFDSFVLIINLINIYLYIIHIKKIDDVFEYIYPIYIIYIFFSLSQATSIFIDQQLFMLISFVIIYLISYLYKRRITEIAFFTVSGSGILLLLITMYNIHIVHTLPVYFILLIYTILSFIYYLDSTKKEIYPAMISTVTLVSTILSFLITYHLNYIYIGYVSILMLFLSFQFIKEETLKKSFELIGNVVVIGASFILPKISISLFLLLLIYIVFSFILYFSTNKQFYRIIAYIFINLFIVYTFLYFNIDSFVVLVRILPATTILFMLADYFIPKLQDSTNTKYILTQSFISFILLTLTNIDPINYFNLIISIVLFSVFVQFIYHKKLSIDNILIPYFMILAVITYLLVQVTIPLLLILLAYILISILLFIKSGDVIYKIISYLYINVLVVFTFVYFGITSFDVLVRILPATTILFMLADYFIPKLQDSTNIKYILTQSFLSFILLTLTNIDSINYFNLIISILLFSVFVQFIYHKKLSIDNILIPYFMILAVITYLLVQVTIPLLLILLAYILISILLFIKSGDVIYKIISYLYINILVVFTFIYFGITSFEVLIRILPTTTILFMLADYFIPKLQDSTNTKYILSQSFISFILLTLTNINSINYFNLIISIVLFSIFVQFIYHKKLSIDNILIPYFMILAVITYLLVQVTIPLLLILLAYILISILLFIKSGDVIYKIISYLYINILVVFTFVYFGITSFDVLVRILPATTILFMLADYFIPKLQDSTNTKYILSQSFISFILLTLTNIDSINYFNLIISILLFSIFVQFIYHKKLSIDNILIPYFMILAVITYLLVQVTIPLLLILLAYILISILLFIISKEVIFKIISYLYINVLLIFTFVYFGITSFEVLIRVIPATTILFMLADYFIPKLQDSTNTKYIFGQFLLSFLLLTLFNMNSISYINLVINIILIIIYIVFIYYKKLSIDNIFIPYFIIIPQIYRHDVHVSLFHPLFIISNLFILYYAIVMYYKKNVVYIIMYFLYSILQVISFDVSKYYSILLFIVGSVISYIITDKGLKSFFKASIYTSILVFVMSFIDDFISPPYIAIYLLPILIWIPLITRTVLKENNLSYKSWEYIGYILIHFIAFFNYHSELDGMIYVSILVIIVLISYILKYGPIFLVCLVCIIINVLIITRYFWLSLPWWLYILIIGIILISFAVYNEKNDKDIKKEIIKKIKDKMDS